METVLYFTDLHVGSHVVELEGVYERAAAHRWRVVEVERERTSRSIADFIAHWRPAGCIMECGRLVSADLPRQFGKIPVVYIDPDRETARTARHTVSNAPAAVAALAARELASLKPKSFAFAGWCAPTAWSVARRAAFEAEVKSYGGGKCAVFDEPWDIGDTPEIQRRLVRFLKPLPKPVGVFAVNDYVAVQLAEACARAGYESPTEVAFVSVDNEAVHCENAIPSITSIELDFKGAGRMAADLLAELVADAALPPRHLTFGPLRLVRRQSSRPVNTADIRIIRAVERIRRDAGVGLTAAEVIAGIGLSRRLAERRFLAATGKTILEEIQEKRLQAIFDLLRTDVPIGHIAARCGMESDSYLKRFFKARTGMTPREWRNAARREAASMAR